MSRGMSKVMNPAGKVLHDRGTSSRPSPPTGVGDEHRGNVKGAQSGGSRAEAAGMGPGSSHLGHAVGELRAQHPHHHSAGGRHSHGHPEHNHRDLK